MKLRKINNVSLTAGDIGVGDAIPVGGDGITHNNFLKIDKIPDELQGTFVAISKALPNNAKNPELLNFLKQHRISMTPLLFAELLSFTKTIAARFPKLGCYDNSRADFYSKNPTANLSDLFEKHLFQCAEFSAIAQLYLQNLGVDSEYVGGEFVGNKTWEFGHQHSFVIIHENGIDYVFDPANNNAGNMPNISIIEMTPEQKVEIQARLFTNKRKVAFFETRDIMTNQKAFYGYGDGLSLNEDLFFTKDSLLQNMPKKDMSRS